MQKKTLIWIIAICAAIICACSWIMAQESTRPAKAQDVLAEENGGTAASDGEQSETPEQAPISQKSPEPLRNIPASFLCDFYGEDTQAWPDKAALRIAFPDADDRRMPLLADSVGVDWFDSRTAGGQSDVFAAALDTEEHHYYLFGAADSEACLFYSTDVYFGGVIFTEEGLQETEDGRARLREEVLPLLDELTDSFYRRISTGTARYSAYCDTILDYCQSLPAEKKLYNTQLKRWLNLQCSVTESGKELYEAVMDDTARDMDYLLFAADVYTDETGAHTLLEQILLRTFCGVSHAVARPIPLTQIEEDAPEEETESSNSKEYPFSFRTQEESRDPRLLLLRWEERGYARAATLELLQDGEVVGSYEIKGQRSPVQVIQLGTLKGKPEFDAVRLRVTRSSGKQTPELRQMTLWGLGVIPAQKTETLLTTEEAAEICLYVNSLMSYGNGPRVRGNRNPTEEELLAYGQGHCGQFAYLFVKELARRGVTDATVYGMVSRYYDNRTANHSVVEVETAEGTRVFDPTFGGWYLADIQTLRSAESVDEYRQGFENATAYYVTERFWKEIYSISIITDQRNTYDTLLNGRHTFCSTGMRSRVSYVKKDPKLDDRTIAVSFRHPQVFYRIACSFEEPVPAMTFACVTVTTPDGDVVTCPTHTLVTGAYSLEIQLDEPIEAKQFEIVFRTGAELPVLYTFYVYG